jgi:integrase
VSHQGQRRTARARTKAEALARKRELLEELVNASSRGTAASGKFTIAEARRLSLQIRWAGTSYERTAGIYSRQAVEHFGPATPLQEITAPAVEAWRQKLLREGNAPSTINRKVSAIRAMQSDAILHGHMLAAPPLPPQLRATGHRQRTISDEEAASFCRFFQEIGEPAAADLLVFLLSSCCRWGEAERLRGQDVDTDRQRVTFWQTKAGRPRTVPLPRRAIDALAPHLPAVKAHRVWPYSYAQFRHLFAQGKAALGLADEEGLTIHTCRHTCASKLASKGVSLTQLMAFGGWSSLAAVQRYLHLQTDALSACVQALEG